MKTFKTQREIYQALLDGKKLRRIGWNTGDYIHIADDTLVDESGKPYRLNLFWDLELYEEPKKKVKMYLYAYKYATPEIVVSSCFYKDDEHFNGCHAPVSWFQRLDWSMIEVE